VDALKASEKREPALTRRSSCRTASSPAVSPAARTRGGRRRIPHLFRSGTAQAGAAADRRWMLRRQRDRVAAGGRRCPCPAVTDAIPSRNQSGGSSTAQEGSLPGCISWYISACVTSCAISSATSSSSAPPPVPGPRRLQQDLIAEGPGPQPRVSVPVHGVLERGVIGRTCTWTPSRKLPQRARGRLRRADRARSAAPPAHPGERRGPRRAGPGPARGRRAESRAPC